MVYSYVLSILLSTFVYDFILCYIQDNQHLTGARGSKQINSYFSILYLMC